MAWEEKGGETLQPALGQEREHECLYITQRLHCHAEAEHLLGDCIMAFGCAAEGNFVSQIPLQQCDL